MPAAGPEGLTGKTVNGETLRVREVWADNLAEEISIIRDIVEDYPYVAMDTEFPGVVARPVGNFKSSREYHYKVSSSRYTGTTCWLVPATPHTCRCMIRAMQAVAPPFSALHKCLQGVELLPWVCIALRSRVPSSGIRNCSTRPACILQ